MTDEKLAAIKARTEAAARGPWMMTGETQFTAAAVWADDGDRIATVEGGQAHATEPGRMAEADANAAFIAHAREDIPALLADNARLREIVRAVADFPNAQSATLTPTAWLLQQVEKARALLYDE